MRLDGRSIGPSRFGIRFAGVSATEATPGLADLQAGGKAFEVALLLVGKVDRERIDFHGARRSSCGHHWWRQRERENDRAETGSAGTRRGRFLGSGPTTPVASEIHPRRSHPATATARRS